MHGRPASTPAVAGRRHVRMPSPAARARGGYAPFVPTDDLSHTAPAAPALVRAARTSDVRAIRALVAPLAERRVLLNKEAVAYYESVSDFVVAEVDGQVVGCGALHVLWEDLGQVRTLATRNRWGSADTARLDGAVGSS